MKELHSEIEITASARGVHGSSSPTSLPILGGTRSSAESAASPPPGSTSMFASSLPIAGA